MLYCNSINKKCVYFHCNQLSSKFIIFSSATTATIGVALSVTESQIVIIVIQTEITTALQIMMKFRRMTKIFVMIIQVVFEIPKSLIPLATWW